MALKDFIVKNFGLKLFSLLLAIVVWYYVNIAVNPTVERTFDRTIRVMNVPEKIMRVEGVPSRIRVTVSGRRMEVLKAFNSPLNPLEVTLDVYGLSAGFHTQKINYTRLTDTDIRVLRVNPSEVKIRLVKMGMRELPVKFSLLGSPARKYVQDEPVIKPGIVKVYGPMEKLRRLLHVSVAIDVTKATGDIQKDQRVRLLDENLEEITDIVADPDSVEVIVGIKPWKRKAVPLEVVIEGELPRGHSVSEVIVSPELINIEAPLLELDKLEQITVGPVNISSLVRSTTIPVEIILPEGEYDMLDSRVVNVRVDIKRMSATREVMDRQVLVKGPEDGFTVTSSPPNLSVILTGPMVKLEKMNLDDVFPEVEVPNKEGTYKVIAGWRLPEEVVVLEGAGKTVEIIVVPVPVGITPESVEHE